MAAENTSADPRGRVANRFLNRLSTVGTRRGPLGVSAWRSIAHKAVYTSRAPVHVNVGSKKRVTPALTLQAGSLRWDAKEDARDAQGHACK